jgi:iron complex outermembrane receptor protein
MSHRKLPCSALLLALALHCPSTVFAADPPALDQPVTLSLEAQPLGEALATVASASGVQLAFAPGLTAGKQAPALKGTFPARQAFDRLLAGSGLALESSANGTLVLRAASGEAAKGEAVAGDAQAERLQVTGAVDGQDGVYTEDRGSVLFRPSDIRETPFSVNVIGEDEIVRRRARNLGDILETDPAASPTYYSNGTTGVSNWGMVRGFHNNQGFTDGVVMIDNDLSQVEMLERVEILRGPAAFRYGFMAPGGVISETTKRPTDDPYAALHTSYDNWGTLYGHVDLGGRFGKDDAFGYRLNVAANQGGGWAGDAVSQRYLVGLTTDYRVSKDTLVTVVLSHSKSRTEGVEWGEAHYDLDNNRLPIDREDDFAPEWAYNQSAMTRGVARIDSRLTDNVDLVVVFGANRADWKYRDFWVGGPLDPTNDNQGDPDDPVNFDYYPGILPDGSGEAGGRTSSEHNYSFSNTAFVNTRFETGAVKHLLTIGYEIARSTFDFAWVDTVPADFNVIERPDLPFPGEADSGGGYRNRVEQYGAFVSDQVDIADRWHGVVGLRFSRITSRSVDVENDATSPRDATNAFTPMVGVLYDVTPELGVYASAGTGVEPGQRAPEGSINEGEQLGSVRSEQYEIGMKWLLAEGRASIDASVFYITRENQSLPEYVEPPAPPTSSFQEYGEQRHIGGEVLVRGRFWQPLLLSAGGQYLDAQLIDQRGDMADAEGDRPSGVPAWQGVLDAVLDITAVPGLWVSGMVKYVGDVELNAPNDDFENDAYTRLDLGVGYAFSTDDIDWDIGLRVENVTDREYFVGTWKSYGAPRTFSLGVDAEF